MKSGKIRDYQITASSSYPASQPSKARESKMKEIILSAFTGYIKFYRGICAFNLLISRILYAIALISRNDLDIDLLLASPWDKKISNSYAIKRGTKRKFVLGCSAKALQNPDPVSVKKKYLKKEIKTSWN